MVARYSAEAMSLLKRFDCMMVDVMAAVVVVSMCAHSVAAAAAAAAVGIFPAVAELSIEYFDSPSTAVNSSDFSLEVWPVKVPIVGHLGTLVAMESYCKDMCH